MEGGLATIIRQLRGNRTRAVFASEYGVTRQAVEQWESGSTKPSQAILEQMGIEIRYERTDQAAVPESAHRAGI